METTTKIAISPKIRSECPICGESQAAFLCRMGGDYLQFGEKGWQYNPTVMGFAGLDFATNPDIGCSYYECSNCGIYYLKEVFPIEDAYGSNRRQDKDLESRYLNTSTRLIRDMINRSHNVAQMTLLALESTGSDELEVLDYGFGGGFDLAVLKAFRIGKVVGFNPFDSLFDLTRRHMQTGITLVSSREEMEQLGPFDAIRCNALLEHVEEPNVVLDHVYDLLKPGGIAWFYAPTVKRGEMRGYARSVQRGMRVKRLHPGHLQFWNCERLPLSTYVERRGFQIIHNEYPIGSTDVTRIKGLLRLIGKHGKRSLHAAHAAATLKIGRYKSGSFFARKTA